MKWKRMPPAAIAAATFAACYVTVILMHVIAGVVGRSMDALMFAPLLSLLALSALAVVVIRRTRRRDDLSAKQKAVLTGFLAGAAAGFPAATVLWLIPTAALFLGLPTSLLGALLDMVLVAPKDTGSVPVVLLRFLLTGPHVFVALNWCLLGSLVGWVASARSEGKRESLKRAGLAVGLVLGPALAFCLGIGFTARYGNLAGWGQGWRLLATRQASNESAAITSLRAVVGAQEAYKRWKGGTTYARPFSRLYRDNGEVVKFIDVTLAESTRRAKAGYHFFDIPFDAEGSPVDPETGFAVGAYPSHYGRSGFKTLFVTRSGGIWQKDTRGYPIVRLPADPAADGWVRVETE